MMSRLSRLLPTMVSGRMARYAVPLAVAGILLLVLSGVAVATLVAPGGFGLTAARLSQTEDLPDALRADGLAALDADNDGVSDALENYLYGTDPTEWNSSGLGIPDGWLVQFGYDPLSPLVADARGVAPPAENLPAAYADGWPDKYRPLLSAYYAYMQPEDYEPGVDEPWWRGGAPYADPSKWDQSGTGIPTGWLVHHGVPMQNLDADRVLPGSLGNLTVRDAFEHDTDPLALDSDGDGLDDWSEINVHGTLPSAFSTAGSGIADGWLLHFGLNAFDDAVASQDPDLDGLTNLEEFFISHQQLEARIATEGIGVLNEAGLDPLDWQTSGTGIPDGWYVRYDLDVFGTDPDEEVGRASDWEHYRSHVPEDLGDNARAADLAMTVREAYEYGRPADWNETVNGVWWGGTNPATLDTDEDGIPDPNEILGWYANVTFATGPEAKPRAYLATSNPLESDSDGDGLHDLEEYLGRSDCGDATSAPRAFPPTDPRNRDTAFSGLTDFEKVCGILREDAKYDPLATGDAALDPTRSDSAGDYMRDGKRVEFWHERYSAYRENPAYPYNKSAYRTVTEWTKLYDRFSGMSDAAVIETFRPDGDVDGDGTANMLDADPSGGLHAQRFGEASDSPSKVYFLGGPQIDPSLYDNTEFASNLRHAASDPANPDTDGDSLPDSWETRYGQFDPIMSSWNLDPANADSDGDGVNDGDANNDNDDITWYGYTRRATGIERQTNTFSYSNRLEFLGGTDPNRASTSGDGIPDGWKAFWGSRVSDDTFPNLLAARDPRLGDVVTDEAATIEAALTTSNIAPLNDLKDQGNPAKVTGYVRVIANLTSCATPNPALDTYLRAGEQLPAEACKANVLPLEGRETNFLLVEGAYRLDYRREVDLRTNPYVVDSDGDGAPDAYEAYMLDAARTRAGSQSAQHPNPSFPDGTRDADGDGVDLAGECGAGPLAQRCFAHEFTIEKPDGTGRETVGAGADPNLVDSDGDGIDDNIELDAGLNPLDPSDVINFRDPTRDSDSDEVPDYLELTGWGKNEFTINVRTDPQDPDTDKDGLLDGPTRTLDPATSGTLVDAWLARGIAHERLSNGSYTFYGERTSAPGFDTRPDTLDSDGSGIPDAWRVYYQTRDTSDGDIQQRYAAYRPTWWDEARHGVWWWGIPAAGSTSTDLDRDGLHDTNGEDPMPWSQTNSVTIGGVAITDPRDLEDAIEEGADAAAVRTRAQSIGDGAGDPRAARATNAARTNANGVLVPLDRANVAIVGLNVTTGATVVNDLPRITKGIPFTVAGQVVLNERTPGGSLLEGTENEPVGVPNRTVLISFFTPHRDTVVGVGFTNETGWFNATANVTSTQAVRIPHEGMVLMGQTSGAGIVLFDTSIVSTGMTSAGQQNRIVAWVTNTSSTATAASPTYGNHLARLPDAAGAVEQRTTHATAFAASEAFELSVFSETRFESTVGAFAVNGNALEGEVRLVDTSGAPVATQRVGLVWTGSTPARENANLFTDRDGVINLTQLAYPVAVQRAGSYAIELRFESADPNLAGVGAEFPVQVRNPTQITVTLSTNATTVGDVIAIEGTLSTRAVRVGSQDVLPVMLGGAPVSVTLGAATAEGQTDDVGRFRIPLQVPGSIGAGAQNILVTFDGTDEAAPSETNLAIGVKRKSAIIDIHRVEGPRSVEASLTGRLVDNEGKGFSGPIFVTGPVGRIAGGEADHTGAFSIGIPLRLLNLGPQQLTVGFPGDTSHSPTTNSTIARVTSSTTLTLIDAPSSVVRGDTIDVRGRLVDDFGAPVPAAAVTVLWRGEEVGTVVTGDDGRVAWTVETNASERPTPAPLALRFTPPAGSVLRGSVASAELLVKTGTTLALEPADVRRGPVRMAGTLMDDEGRPLPTSVVEIRVGDEPVRQVITARNGTFALDAIIRDDVPLGPLDVTAAYRGTASLAEAADSATWRVRSPITLDLSDLGPFVRGESASIRGRSVDDQGASVNLPVTLTLDGVKLGEARPNAGVIDARLEVPANQTRGFARLVISTEGTDEYEPYTKTYEVVVKIRPQIEVNLPALAVRGFTFTGDVTLLDDHGEPLRNTTFAYVMGANGSPVTGRTDADGKAEVALVAPVTGDAVVGFTVRGGPDVVSASSTYTGVRAVGPATPIGYIGLALVALVVIAIVIAVVVAITLRRRQLTEARDIIDEAIRELLAGNEYAGTIFLAYRRFVAHLARHGFTEKASDTPREFALGVRKALPVGAVPLRELIRLFEEARYSDHAIGTQERDRAVESLALVRGELDRLLGRKTNAPAPGVPA